MDGEPAGEQEADENVQPEASAVAMRDAWNAAAEGYGAAETLTHQAAPALLAAIRPRPGVEILEIGCGRGGLATAAQALDARVTAIDVAPAMVRLASAGVGDKGPEFRIGDAVALDTRAEAFDAGFANFCVLECGAPEAALREMARAVKTGGRFAWSFWPAPGGGALFELTAAARDDLQSGEAASAPSERGAAPETARAMMEAVGFGAVQIVSVPLEIAADAEALLDAVAMLDAPAMAAPADREALLGAMREAIGEADKLVIEAFIAVGEKGAPIGPVAAEPTTLADGKPRGGLLGVVGRLLKPGQTA